MTNGGINVEIGNPSYNMYEVDHDNHADAGSLLRPNFTLDPHKVGPSNSASCYTTPTPTAHELYSNIMVAYCFKYDK